VRTSGQTPPAQLVVGPVFQKDAPIQVVGIKESGDNTLAAVIIKNTTDKYVQDFTITWTVLRPVNCAASGSAPRVSAIMRAGTSGHAEDRGLLHGLIPLPHGHTWPSRVLKPHEQTEITSLSLTRMSLLEMATKNNAKKLRVQVGIAYVNYTTGDKFTSRSGPPDWRDKTVEETNIIDAEDAAKQTCSP
jgi:hypothetical protein